VSAYQFCLHYAVCSHFACCVVGSDKEPRAYRAGGSTYLRLRQARLACESETEAAVNLFSLSRHGYRVGRRTHDPRVVGRARTLRTLSLSNLKGRSLRSSIRSRLCRKLQTVRMRRLGLMLFMKIGP